MKLTKLGHSCLVIEEGDLKILMDPGNVTTAQNEVRGIDVVLITHPHGDHLDINSLKTIIANNSGVKTFTNKSVGAVLEKENIVYELLEAGQSITEKHVRIEGFGKEHAEIYETVLAVDNTGYLIGGRFFNPGDSFYNPGVPVEILALPVSAPWLKLSEAIVYAKTVKPKKCFPVHDGMFSKMPGSIHNVPDQVLPLLGIEFFIPKEGEVIEL